MSQPNWVKQGCFVFVLCAATAIVLPAQTFTTLYSFAGFPAEGSNPDARLVQGTDGNLYGTTRSGGANISSDGGTVFKITPAGTLTTLYSFCPHSGCPDGANPSAALVQATNGNFYGTTGYGGTSSACVEGCGTVFEITPSGTLTTLYSFCWRGGSSCTDGSEPFAALVQGTDGNFYGTTAEGGTNSCISGGVYSGCGTIFKITPSGTLTTLHSFDGADGARPGALIQATDGNLYGTTCGELCGASGDNGTLFKITLSGTLTTLYSFCSQSDCTDGLYPEGGLVQGADGNFYGTTAGGGANATCYGFGGGPGCGTAFKVTPGGTLTTLYSFCSQSGCTDGEVPDGGLVQGIDGNFYGITVGGGANTIPTCFDSSGGVAGCGTLFKISPSGTLTTLYNFCSQSDCTDGADPYAGLIQDTNGTFYGTTQIGGTNNECPPYGCGTVFSLSVGLGPFVETQPASGKVGAAVLILGTDLTGTTSVSFNGTAAAFTVVSSSEITTAVPAGASDGSVQVITPGGTLSSNVPFRVIRPLSLGLHFDFDDDNGTDYTVWRPSNGNWYVLPTGVGPSITKQWGENGDLVVPGDYDGDGITDYAIWRPSTGRWWVILSSTGKSTSFGWGESTDIPVPGDYDGDGKTDYAIWRPSTGRWWVILSSTGKSTSFGWGESTDIPVPGDYDGDGKTDYAVWRPSTSTWWVILSSTGKSTSQQWGESTDIPVPGDYDGDGKTDYAVWRPSNGTWYVVDSSTGKSTSYAWGESTDIPVPRDYDGDNKTDYAFWRPSNGTWYVVDSSTGKTTSVHWGLSTDVPVNKPTGQ